MPSLPDGIVIFVLALLLLGPKKLPALARELGKWIGEFRRASNEFKMQMEEEMRVVEQSDRQKEIAAITASAPPTAALPGVPTTDPEHPHTDQALTPAAEATLEAACLSPEPSLIDPSSRPERDSLTVTRNGETTGSLPNHQESAAEAHTDAYPIATSGELRMMPPATGLPTSRAAAEPTINSIFDSIPAAENPNG